MAKHKIIVKDTPVRIEGNYICLTDIAKSGRGLVSDIIKNYLRNKNNIDFLGQWEQLNNESFNLVNYDQIKNNTGMNDFVLSIKKWISETHAVGIRSKARRYGGTFAHKEIAYHFATWLNAGFYLYLIKEFDRLKNDEAVNAGLRFEARREIAKANYPFQKIAIDKQLLKAGKRIGKKNKVLKYANEADLLNVLLFGCTASEWKLKNPKKKGNIRDHAVRFPLGATTI